MRVVNLAPAVEFVEQLVGGKEREQLLGGDIGYDVQIQFWKDDDLESWAIDIFGPEPERIRRFILHADVDLLDLSSLVEVGEPAEPAR